MSESDVYTRQILTSKVGPRAKRVKTMTTILIFYTNYYGRLQVTYKTK